jgi:integrase
MTSSFGTPSTDLTEYVADDAAPLRESVRRPAPDDADSLRQSVRRPAAKISPVRLDNLKSAVTLAANAMIAAGGSPQRLRDLVDPRVAEQTVQTALLRQRRKNPAARPKHSYLKSLAGDFLKIGRLIGISPSDEQMLVDLRDDYDPYLLEIRKNDKGEDKRIFDTERMGPRHADRLDQFNDAVKLHAWFQMMPLLYQRMKDIVRAGREPAPIEVNDAIVCVLHAITQSCPVRRENLAKITIGGREPWLRLPAFRGDRARLTIPAQFVKNLKQIDAELTAEAAEIVRCFIEHFRPAMAKAVRASSDNRFLFPAAGRKARSGDQLNKIFVARNCRVGGFRLNIHCQRHVCAKIILDEDPTRMALVQILLDHKSIVTTGRFYARINKIIALREFHQLVAKRRQALIDLMSEKKRHSAPRRKRSDKGGREDERM